MAISERTKATRIRASPLRDRRERNFTYHIITVLLAGNDLNRHSLGSRNCVKPCSDELFRVWLFCLMNIQTGAWTPAALSDL